MKTRYNKIEAKVNTGFKRHRSSLKKSRRAKSKVLIPLNTNQISSRTLPAKSQISFRSSLNSHRKRKIKHKVETPQKEPANLEPMLELEAEIPIEENLTPHELCKSLKSKISFLKKRKRYIGKKQRIEDEEEIENLKKRLDEALETEAELRRIEEQKKMLSIESGLSAMTRLRKKLDVKDQKKFLVQIEKVNSRIKNLEISADEFCKESLVMKGFYNLQSAVKKYKRRFLFLRNFSKILRNCMKEKKRRLYCSVFRSLKFKKKSKPFHLISRRSQRNQAKKERTKKSKGCKTNRNLKKKTTPVKTRDHTPNPISRNSKSKIRNRSKIKRKDATPKFKKRKKLKKKKIFLKSEEKRKKIVF